MKQVHLAAECINVIDIRLACIIKELVCIHNNYLTNYLKA